MILVAQHMDPLSRDEEVPTQSQLLDPELPTGTEDPGEPPSGRMQEHQPAPASTTQPPDPSRIAPGHFVASLQASPGACPISLTCGSWWLPGTHSANGLELGFQHRGSAPGHRDPWIQPEPLKPALRGSYHHSATTKWLEPQSGIATTKPSVSASTNPVRN